MKRSLILTGIFSVGFLALSCGGGTANPETSTGLQYAKVNGSVSSSVQGFSSLAISSQPRYVVASTSLNGQQVSGGTAVDGNGNFVIRLIKGKEYTFSLYDSNGNCIGSLSSSIQVDGDSSVTINLSNISNQCPAPSLADSDGDGTPDAVEDNDSDKIPDSFDDYDCNGVPEALEHKDSDHDGVPNYIDNDDDGDGKYDLHDSDDNGDEIEDEQEGEYEHGRCQAQQTGMPSYVPPPSNNQGGGNTGGGSTTVSFSNNVLPILNNSCAGCHGGAGNFHLSTATDRYAEVIRFVDTTNPSNSRLLLKATNTISHGGGQIFSTTSTQYQTILQWIQSGAPNN